MATSSPPMTPTRQYIPPLDTSPAQSYREHLRRRTSSFSSQYDRSPASARPNRFSNASQFSHEYFPTADDGTGAGNLADELDAWDEDLDEEEEEEETGGTVLEDAGDPEDSRASPVDGARDSGIDVSYGSNRHPSRMKSLSRSSGASQKVLKEAEEEEQNQLSVELEDAMNSIARMASYTTTSDDPLIPRTIGLLQDLGNQSGLEANTQRLATSTNAMTSHLAAQTKSIQALAATFYIPASYSPIGSDQFEEVAPLLEALLRDLPLPDPSTLQGIQKLDRETSNVIQTLSKLTDTLQIGRQMTNSASRHLRSTQSVVSELRRERERAEMARVELGKGDWNARIQERWCAGECKDIMGGFESVCDSLRDTLEQACAGAAAA